MSAWRVAALATFALIALQWAWTWAAGPHPHLAFWFIAGVWSVLLLPPAILFLLRRPRAPLWAGIVALFYFCHGITVARTGEMAWPWPWTEIALSLAIVFAAGLPGIAAKLARRRAAPPPNV